MTYKVQAAAQLLATTVDTVRRMADRFEIDVAREAVGTKTRLFSLENIFEIAHHRAATRPKPVRERPIVVTTYATKVGAGSTTVASNLGVLLALRGLRTLLVDLDSEAGLTRCFGYQPDMTESDVIDTNIDRSNIVDYHFGHLLFQENADHVLLTDVLKQPYGNYGPHLVPADLRLFQLEGLAVEDARGLCDARHAIRTFVENGRCGKNSAFDISKYDVVLFDAPPAVVGTTLGILDVTDFLVSSVSVDGYSGKALSLLSRLIQRHRQDLGRSLELILVGNRFSLQRMNGISTLASATEGIARSWLKGGIPYIDAMHDSQFRRGGLPLVLYAPGTQAAADMCACVDSILERVGLAT